MYSIEIEDFSLDKIARSGQCFRMSPVRENVYRVIAKDSCLIAEQKGSRFTFSCEPEEFEQIWRSYFDLGTDYGAIRAGVDPEDQYLLSALEAGSGVRILRQDLWEILVTFLISQNNNIPRIKNSIEAICSKYGRRHKQCTELGESTYYTFPGASDIAQGGLKGLEGLGLGYRDKYILSMAEKCSAENGGERWLKELQNAEYADAHKMLLEQFGVGKKVADCVCLFGLHHVGAFPVDTHIRQILELHYPSGFPLERYQGYAGILQQYLFFQKLNG